MSPMRWTHHPLLLRGRDGREEGLARVTRRRAAGLASDPRLSLRLCQAGWSGGRGWAEEGPLSLQPLSRPTSPHGRPGPLAGHESHRGDQCGGRLEPGARVLPACSGRQQHLQAQAWLREMGESCWVPECPRPRLGRLVAGAGGILETPAQRQRQGWARPRVGSWPPHPLSPPFPLLWG